MSRVFEIDELARLISSHLLSTDRRTLVSLACTCRALEVPALSSLWETQCSFTTLIRLLPVTDEEITQRDALGNPWYRFRRYASWMCQLSLTKGNPRVADIPANRLLMGSTNGLLCPNLCQLYCHITEPILPLIPLFLSPRLTHLTLLDYKYIARPDLGPILQVLPTQFLQDLFLNFGPEAMKDFADEISQIIQRCGNSLRRLHAPMPLGEAAVHHLLSLTDLQIWENVHSVPPITQPSSTIFPSLRALTLGSKEAQKWIPWLTRRKTAVRSADDRPLEHSRLQTTLTHLGFLESVSVDAAFISPLLLFPNLVILDVKSNCWQGLDCAFSLTNQDVVDLSSALPRLERLDLGPPCAANAACTTVSCFRALSINCKLLRSLRIHFNTTNLVNDVRSLSADPDFRDARSLPTKCPLKYISVGHLPFPREMSDEEITTVARVLMDIFPSLLNVVSYVNWDLLTSEIGRLQETFSN